MSRTSPFREVPIQVVREYWDRRPCNVRHSPSPLGTREYFDEVEARKYFVEPHIPGFAAFEQWRGRKVLEIGCGIGTDTINFARAGAFVTAVDVSRESLELARRRAGLFGLQERIRFQHADAEELSRTLRPEFYDLVYAFGVVHHTPRPERVIGEIRTHFSRPGTTLKLMVYHRLSWKSLQTVLTRGGGRFWKMDEIVAEHSEAQTGCPVTYTFTRRGLRSILRESFEIVDMRVAHIFPYRIEDYVQYRYVKHWHFRLLPPGVFRWLESRLGWHLCVTAVAR